VRPDGTVKVLDFGLAKAADGAGGEGGSAMNSPTITARTQVGTILGTAAYMSPEQARGRPVDRRADIWAFGAIVYEMLTARRAFPGDDVSDILASVLKTDPDWTAVPAGLPSSIVRLLRRCLDKDPKVRLSAIGDARFDLFEADPAPVPSSSVAVTAARSARPSLLGRILPVVAAVLITALAAYASRPTPASSVPLRASLLAPPDQAMYPDSVQVAISPDGSMVAFVSGDFQAQTGIWVRPIGSLTATRLDSTEGGNLPFWSADSKRLAFFTADKLRTVAVAGGPVQTVCAVPGQGGRGGTWNHDNVIVFARDATGPLWRVPASGGEPVAVTTLEAKQSSHRFPTFLPDGTHFLYAALPGHNGQFDIFVGTLGGGAPVPVGPMESAPVYAPSGHLLYMRQNVLMAQRFDATAFKLSGDPLQLPDQPTTVFDPTISYTAGKLVSISRAGAIAYFSAPPVKSSATTFDLAGHVKGKVSLGDAQFSAFEISPDGAHAVAVRSVSANESSLWLIDMVHGGATPLSAGAGRNDTPVWSPDGTRVVFASDRDGPTDIYLKTIGDPSPERLFFHSPVLFKNPESWTTDGKWILLQVLDPETAQNIYRLSADHPDKPELVVGGPKRDFLSRVSPDGRWIMYSSDETGRFQTYVDSVATPGHKRQLSTDGGVGGAWSKDGKRVLFVGADFSSVWQADVKPGSGFDASKPVRLFGFPATNVTAFGPNLQYFLAVTPDQPGVGSITVAQNWLPR